MITHFSITDELDSWLADCRNTPACWCWFNYFDNWQNHWIMKAWNLERALPVTLWYNIFQRLIQNLIKYERRSFFGKIVYSYKPFHFQIKLYIKKLITFIIKIKKLLSTSFRGIYLSVIVFWDFVINLQISWLISILCEYND